MRGNPAIPHAMCDVELAGRCIDVEIVSRKANLVHERIAAHMHALFVEGHEANAVDHTFFRQAERRF